MGFTGTEGNNSGGVYTYPYDFTIDSSSTTYQLMCDDITHMISAPENWTATTLNVSSLNATNVLGLEFPSAGVTGYLEASFLFAEEVCAYNASNSDPEGLYNWAVWDLLTASDISGAHLSGTDEAQVQTYLNTAEGLGSTLTPSQFNDVVIYTPIDMSSGGPQEFSDMTRQLRRFRNPPPSPCSASVRSACWPDGEKWRPTALPDPHRRVLRMARSEAAVTTGQLRNPDQFLEQLRGPGRPGLSPDILFASR